MPEETSNKTEEESAGAAEEQQARTRRGDWRRDRRAGSAEVGGSVLVPPAAEGNECHNVMVLKEFEDSASALESSPAKSKAAGILDEGTRRVLLRVLKERVMYNPMVISASRLLTREVRSTQR